MGLPFIHAIFASIVFVLCTVAYTYTTDIATQRCHKNISRLQLHLSNLNTHSQDYTLEQYSFQLSTLDHSLSIRSHVRRLTNKKALAVRGADPLNIPVNTLESKKYSNDFPE